MTQVSRPTAISGTGWTGVYASLADDNDATYVESPESPTVDEPLTAEMQAVSAPGSQADHVVTVRVEADPESGDAELLDVDVELLDGSDDSVVAATTEYGIGTAAQNVVLTLTEAEAANVNYSNIKVRVKARVGALLVPTHYVTATGSASWANATNPETPCSAATAMANAAADDVVQFAAGTYTAAGSNDRWIAAFRTTNEGTVGHPITLQAEAGATVTLQLSSGTGPTFGSDGKNYVHWHGFTVNEADSPFAPDTGPVVLHDCVGCVIRYCFVNGDPLYSEDSDNYCGVRLNDTVGCAVRYTRIHDFASAKGAAFETYNSVDVLFEHNEVYDCSYGISQKGDVEAPANGYFVARFNLIYDCGVGINTHRRMEGDSTPYLIYQNIIRGCDFGIEPDPNGGVDDDRYVFYLNNTIDDCSVAVWVRGVFNADANYTLKNNLLTHCGIAIWSEDTTLANLADAARFSSNRNCWHGLTGNFYDVSGGSGNLTAWRSGTPHDDDSVTDDPLYSDEGAYNFRLQAGSPALTLGRALHGVGGADDATIPAGAYITGNEIIGRTV